MGELILVTGGARSGKSSFAESLLQSEEKVCYIATSTVAPNDAEMQERVRKHQEQRPKEWHTEERFTGIGEYLSESGRFDAYLLDCATLLSTNYFYDAMVKRFGEDYTKIDQVISQFNELEKQDIEQEILKEWQAILTAVSSLKGKMIVVTNEVGLGIVPEQSFSRWFRDVYGHVNQLLGCASDEAYLVVSGIPVKIK
ncbi:TPA: bifunctional adenosylcobinamide kinase/adenosylcobinamide-phosphate guanylyltransferase [Enterococcus faecalis]|uniref:bifunctional adenosylcobinamide kinase/adenosylcobinamide-phosphate guanylyltransferase n=1 Tax=Enterococcus faecalis TaxID=1351 RepID=UPI0011431E81|nr:bifunctional adenosylcobinamide kinase/adenosylcobinamide-phosphate guanylyltransferase [Enterococcus faecalis]EHV0153384.1 bifunctional adenosylcobinamide kinase/adenosylcobinamide-phosphate guanylyltransferase [Enterococcus faecalis]NSV46797.1 bifunctional adenosylcobinamide kinase/adenosylcobinamide-phosphate guanylyltransferase [Enterococcus faecalis]TQA42056.1 bifunctional adenosylcobinamide kinase/adenosylcobinamide-phosphate guanylyltransferase [Enterococcus faecalis]HDT8169891.1 bifu